MFEFFERLIAPTASPSRSPSLGIDKSFRLLRFYWHFISQVPLLVLSLFVTGLIVAVVDTQIPVFIGEVTSLVSSADPLLFVKTEKWKLFFGTGLVVVCRPIAILAQGLVSNQAIIPGLPSLIRWQSHWHVVRQSWSFFQADFAGRVANRVLQTGSSVRESLVQGVNAIWYLTIYGIGATALLGSIDLPLAVPILLWFASYIIGLRVFVPRMQRYSKGISDCRSELIGRVVDSYTNFLTIKLFSRLKDEDTFIRDAANADTEAFQKQLRLITLFSFFIACMNAFMLGGMTITALALWNLKEIPVGTVATALTASWQLSAMAGTVASNIVSLFENLGAVQDGMQTIAVPQEMTDRPSAMPLLLQSGSIGFVGVDFNYGRGEESTTSPAVFKDLNLELRAGEHVGLIGRSGVGKSTLISLLLRLYSPSRGKVLIDDQDIAEVTQESLRAQIGVVSQDTSLLNRSILDNLRYGKPEASYGEIVEAARQADALEFIEQLQDWRGRRGFEAHVGERGVRLSGGQRQRIAIARVILKDAPILVLDEATSALDSQSESLIQQQLGKLMQGRTVLAIAHRLSTLISMDRLALIDDGRIIQNGSHEELLAQGGLYASLWRKQSGGFIRW